MTPRACQTARVRVLVAPDCFTGTLTAGQAAAAMTAGWARYAPGDELVTCPLSDGGPGFLDVLHAALGGRLEPVRVTGPLGGPVDAAVLLVGDVAYVESASACGLHLVPLDRRDPGLTTTAGVGDLVHRARALGARRIVIGLGGSGTNDGGAGFLGRLAQAEGLPAGPRWEGGGAALAGCTGADLAWLPQLRRAWAGVELELATDVEVPLLGFHGASAGFAAQKGATPQRAQQLEGWLGEFAAAATAALGAVWAPGGRVDREPGAGAAGGLGFAGLLLGATRVGGAAAVLDAVRFGERVRSADLVLTGEGRFDWQSLRGKVVSAVAAAALDQARPVVVVAGQVEVGRRETQAIGVAAAYAVAEGPDAVAAALADPERSLADRVERVARTWSTG